MTTSITVTFSLRPGDRETNTGLYLHIDGADSGVLLGGFDSLAHEAKWWGGELLTPARLPGWLVFDVIPEFEAEAILYLMDNLDRFFRGTIAFQAVPFSCLPGSSRGWNVVHRLLKPAQVETIVAVLLDSAA